MTPFAWTTPFQTNITVDSAGNSWLTEFTVSHVDRITVNGTITQLPTPHRSASIIRENVPVPHGSPRPANAPPLED